MEGGLGRRVVGDQRGCARPADLDAAEQVGLGARHAQQARRLEGGALAEDLLVGLEAHLGAAPVLDGAELLELALRRAARERHGVELLAARHLDLELLRQRVDDRDADAVQAARGVVDLAVEFAARVQRGHDHFERGLGLELGVRVDGDAAAVVGDGQEAVGLDLDLDPGGVAGHRLVHGVVDHLGEQVVQRLLVGAADVHAGPAPHGLEAFQHLDVGGGVAVGALGGLANGTNHFLFRLLLRLGLLRGLFLHDFGLRPARREAPAPLPAAPPASSALPRACGAWTRRICRTGRARHERLAWVSSPLLA